jgi:hypothetical protein
VMNGSTTDKTQWLINPINKGILCIYNIMNGQFLTQGKEHG